MSPKFLALLICTLPLAAEEQMFQLDPAHTVVTFTLGDVLHTVHGTFKVKSGSIRFDPTSGAASGQIVVDVTSGDSGSGSRDRRMHKEILESARYPEAVFTPVRVSGAFNPRGDSQLDVRGAFQIHGSNHDVTLPFRVQAKSGEASAVTHLTIPYVQWGMKNPRNFLLRVSDKVELNVEAHGRLDAASAARSE